MDEFDSETSDMLTGDQPRRDTTSALTKEIAREARIANDHRERLFKIIVGIVIVGIAASGAFIFTLGYGLIELATPVAVAFISAMAVQSFVLIGLLVKGLFVGGKPASARPVE